MTRDATRHNHTETCPFQSNCYLRFFPTFTQDLLGLIFFGYEREGTNQDLSPFSDSRVSGWADERMGRWRSQRGLVGGRADNRGTAAEVIVPVDITKQHSYRRCVLLVGLGNKRRREARAPVKRDTKKCVDDVVRCWGCCEIGEQLFLVWICSGLSFFTREGDSSYHRCMVRLGWSPNYDRVRKSDSIAFSLNNDLNNAGPCCS